ncbi:hypothetical protein BN8_00846 [Fibrisoma limi BUZ 3]|uniref:Uncharacterized protein n=1 Tax=Fibrisoma limi BUZ 3 TaxID=1185876 RepID=I2GDB4_9BACT|nr:hypothetical protein [Fibrisoma limi]CCH51888.1 hypothetical protein BN8_00846 [Fibrisoma limi BUZ 3]
MAQSANLSDGAREANQVSSDDAETMFGADQAETHMVKLVDGKLEPTGHTTGDVSEDMPRIRLGSDEERALTGDDKKKYETSEAALRSGGFVTDSNAVPDDPIATAEITGNPDAGASVNTGLPSEDEPANDRTETDPNATPTSSFGGWAFPAGDMIPPTPGTPDPNNPVPPAPETPQPPTPGGPVPEYPPLPEVPPVNPPIQEPGTEPLPDINATNFVTFTSSFSADPTSGTDMPGDILGDRPEREDVEPGEAVPGNQYEGMSTGPEEGMEDEPDTGDSARPYDVNAKDNDTYQPGERPQEATEMREQPRASMDESSVKADDMITGSDRSDQKSTEGLDLKYNDPEAARQDVI